MNAWLAWERPAFAWLLLLPVALYVLLRARARPPERVTGTLELWKRVAGAAPEAQSAARARPPRWAWAILAALTSGALALAGPRPAAVRAGQRWTALVDRSPSTDLPWRAHEGDATPAQESRLEAALARALAWLEQHAGAADRVRWLAPGREPLERARGERPDARWLARRPWPEPEPRWELHDEHGTLWISDDPALAPARAGLFASGGAAVPGPVAADGRARIDWDGERLAEVALDGPAREVALLAAADGTPVPAVLARVAQAWSEARGFAVSAVPSERTALRLEVEPADEPELELVAGRDGWTAHGRVGAAGVAPPAEDGPGAVWLDAEAGGRRLALVRAAPGRIRVAWRALDEPAGDPAAFAVSWAELLDRWALPAPSVVALRERRALGEPFVHPPHAPAPAEALRRRSRPQGIDAALAFAATLLAVVGVSSWHRKR